MLGATAIALPAPPSYASATAKKPLSGRRVAFTTPPSYGARFAHLLHLRGASPIPLPTVAVDYSLQTLAAVRPFLHREVLEHFSAILFTSRTGVSAVALALADSPPPLSESGDCFVVAALGRDAETLNELHLLQKLCHKRDRIQLLVPKIASPMGLVEALGEGFGRRALCPVPTVIGLEEPPVVPEFLRGLEVSGWVPTRVPAYETRWAGPRSAEELVKGKIEVLDAIVFTSTAEVEGLVKGLETMGLSWRTVREKWPEMVVAAHGPVTAKGAERFGVAIDLVSSKFSSFEGVMDVLAQRLALPQ
ncbi:hypothetical protein AXF42_Ash002366 [Apostasia shenzhenica]|uniref:Tetrapyrrole biosynthesis uroporphyrinogen III synthase domain-containing protein n=1 Tax=Apostasia shenzhenica TaxID=1088818 RepID=A0A2I0ANC2_9ASPA|nr:hypothetical protein AXF42_Ash002366 [Apostasia shenzhenica]